jgi:glycosyltransferase involved in cell wall biosynthesis
MQFINIPTVYVICPALNAPSGGIMKLYEFVDTLNAHNVNSFIVYADSNFKNNWFDNVTKTTTFQSICIKQDDILVIPEVIGEEILQYFPTVRKIIFCQNSFFALKMFYGKPDRAKKFYLHRDIIQVIVVSDHDYDLFEWIFPGIKLSRFICGISEKLFYFTPHKQMQIAVMPRKLPSDYHFLENLLRVKADLADIPIKTIENIPHAECAAILRESAIFISFSHREGFGLPPAEAMACGCMVIGYHGQGGKEYFTEDTAIHIEPWDMLNYAKAVSNIIQEFTTNKMQFIEQRKKSSEFILGKYSIKNQEQSILQIIAPLIS